MKKLLIASTALVAAAGMASADITITGHAAAGIYSGLSNKDGKAKTTAPTSSKSLVYVDVANDVVVSPTDSTNVSMTTNDVLLSGTDAVATVTAATVGTYSGDGIYSNAGVDFTMSGATDNGISFSASVKIIYYFKPLKLLTQSIEITKKVTYLTGFSSGGPKYE